MLICYRFIYHIYYICDNIIAVTCEDLNLENGKISYNEPPGHFVDTVASFSCDYGFSLSGSSSSTCENSGSWNHQAPACRQGN